MNCQLATAFPSHFKKSKQLILTQIFSFGEKIHEWESEYKQKDFDKASIKKLLEEKTKNSIKKWGNRSIAGNIIVGDKNFDMYSPSKAYLKLRLP